MKAKRVIFVVISTLGGFLSANAQSLKVHPRVEVAGNFANIISKVKGERTEVTDIKPGVRVGTAIEIPIGKSGLFVAPGITYKMQGAKETEKHEDDLKNKVEHTQSISLHYLSVPVDLGFRINLEPVAVSFEVGPYFAYALKGTTETKEAFISKELVYGETTMSVDLFKKDKHGDQIMRRYDIGVGASAAVEYSRFYLRLGSELGLTNIADESFEDEGLKSRNVNFYVGLGFRF